MRRKPTYRTPRNATERIAEAKAAIERLRYTMSQGDNCFGYYGRQCRESIARWQAVIDREQKEA